MSVLRPAKRAARRAVDATTRQAGAAVDLLRLGDRTVLRTPPAGMRLGNFLYLWLHAHGRSTPERPVRVLESRGMAQWWQVFPRLRDLSVTRDELRFSDRREWEPEWLYQRFGIDFARPQLHAFIDDALLPALAPGPSDGRLVINVRRGDFYATEFEAKHGFDVVGYVTAAVAHFDGARSALVVSDDADWCRTHLGDLLIDRIGDIEYAAPDPLANLRAIASAQRLIGANSTFSYWGAYIADRTHEHAQIVMPRFLARMAHGHDAHQLDPSWTALDGFA